MVKSLPYYSCPHYFRSTTSDFSVSIPLPNVRIEFRVLMLLADNSVIAALMPQTSTQQVRKPYTRPAGQPLSRKRSPNPKRQVCSCGDCFTCVGNAKWNVFSA